MCGGLISGHCFDISGVYIASRRKLYGKSVSTSASDLAVQHKSSWNFFVDPSASRDLRYPTEEGPDRKNSRARVSHEILAPIKGLMVRPAGKLGALKGLRSRDPFPKRMVARDEKCLGQHI